MIIDQLNPTVSDNLTDEVPVEQGTATFKTTWQKILNLFKSNIGLTASDISSTDGNVQDDIDDLQSGKVSKSGDTMSGDLGIRKSVNPTVSLINTDMDNTAQTLSADELSSVNFKDGNGNLVGFVNAVENTSGADSINIVARKSVSGSNVDNILTMYVDKVGGKGVSVSDPNAWLEALGLGTIENHQSISDVIVAGSGISITAVNASVWGKLVQIGITFSCNAAISTSSVTVGTLKDGFIPAQYSNWAESSLRSCGDITSGGVVRVRKPTGGSDIAANTSISMRAIYMRA